MILTARLPRGPSQVLVLREGPVTPLYSQAGDSEAYVVVDGIMVHEIDYALLARTAQPLGWGRELLVRCEPNEIEMEGSTTDRHRRDRRERSRPHSIRACHKRG